MSLLQILKAYLTLNFLIAVCAIGLLPLRIVVGRLEKNWSISTHQLNCSQSRSSKPAIKTSHKIRSMKPGELGSGALLNQLRKTMASRSMNTSMSDSILRF